MKSTIQKTTVYTLELDEEEAAWLRGLVQNQLTEHERPIDSEMRKKIWDALTPPQDVLRVSTPASPLYPR